MNLREAAVLLVYSRESMLDAIRDGVQLPVTKTVKKLAAHPQGSDFEITDIELDAFIAAFEAEEPGRHPPIVVRRHLRVECSHKCAICRSDLPLQFHHILQWCELKHHDPNHMLAICGGCHDKIGVGQIDRTEQRRYKLRVQDLLDNGSANHSCNSLFPDGAATPLAWTELRDVLGLIHDTIVSQSPTAQSQFDFTDVILDEKNRLNKLGADSFAVMREEYEPFFGRIQSFLESPTNTAVTQAYHEVVDEIRVRIAGVQNGCERFEDLLNRLFDVVCQRFGDQMKGRRRTLRVLISFMYFNCDIGRKA